MAFLLAAATGLWRLWLAPVTYGRAEAISSECCFTAQPESGPFCPVTDLCPFFVVELNTLSLISLYLVAQHLFSS